MDGDGAGGEEIDKAGVDILGKVGSGAGFEAIDNAGRGAGEAIDIAGRGAGAEAIDIAGCIGEGDGPAELRIFESEKKC